MPRFHVDDVGGKSVAVVQLEFVNPKIAGRLFRLDEGFPVHRVKFFEAFLVNFLDNIFSKACNLGHLLERVCLLREQFPCVVVKRNGDSMAFRLE